MSTLTTIELWKQISILAGRNFNELHLSSPDEVTTDIKREKAK